MVRALNVLRQYDETSAAAVCQLLRRGLAEGGLLVEGTCDELGRRACWVASGADGPRTLTLAAHLGSLAKPSDLAGRLPKSRVRRDRAAAGHRQGALRRGDRTLVPGGVTAATGARD